MTHARWLAPLLILTPSFGAARAQDAPHARHEPGHADGPKHTPAEMNKRFADPDLDVSEFIKRFEGENRDVFARREALVALVDPKPGQAIADVGAGTGLFTRLFAEKVGPGGTVYAVEIAPAFLKHIAARAEADGQARIIQPLRGGDTTTNLPAGSVDAVFLCATYHHFEHPRKMLASMHEALRPGGRLILVEWDLKPDSSDHIRDRARGPRAHYHQELADAGFELVAEHDEIGLADNFAAVYRRVERAGGGEGQPSTP